MKVQLGRMKATIGYACTPGRKCVEKGNIVIVIPATNMPPRECIDYFVARVNDPDNSIGCTEHEIDIFDEIEGCHVCDSCCELCDNDLCNDCTNLED